MVSEQIRRHIEQDAFARALGIELVELREGFAECAMRVREDQLNFHGSLHGGAIFSLADAAFGAACNASGQTAVALEMNINFLNAVAPGARLVAEAKEESASARIALYHLTVTDEQGRMIASLHATAYKKNERFG
ncbi:MAG: hydroxyphenylacetyl-CoA thioesterase PaaI [Chloroflexi bacterium]|nr:hydroxyphenylacetyl-CoA thioesterase PaaI [Chloroflexota bacterium]